MVIVLYDYRDLLRLVPPVPRTSESEKVLDFILSTDSMFRHFLAARHDGRHRPTDTGVFCFGAYQLWQRKQNGWRFEPEQETT